jgi:hypothetical protein
MNQLPALHSHGTHVDPFILTMSVFFDFLGQTLVIIFDHPSLVISLSLPSTCSPHATTCALLVLLLPRSLLDFYLV